MERFDRMELKDLTREADWETRMKQCPYPAYRVIGVDWRHSGLCAQQLTGVGQTLQAGLLLAEGEYIHRRNGGTPELFFCRMMGELVANLSEDGGGGATLFLISVPAARLPRRQTADFAACLERTLEPFVKKAAVILLPGIRVVWEHCYGGGGPGGPAGEIMGPATGGVIRILEDETQFLFEPGRPVVAAFGSRLAGRGAPQRYYSRPVRYRENNYLYEADRFLWQDAAYASWYQGFYQISKRVLAAQAGETVPIPLMLTGDPDCLSCAEKALTDMEAVSADDARNGRLRAMDIPAYLLEWYCRVHGCALAPAREHFACWQEDSEENPDIWSI